MFRKPTFLFVLLIVFSIALIAVDLPENYRVSYELYGKKIDYMVNPVTINIPFLSLRKEFRTHLGLDLAGGSHIVLEANMDGITESERTNALDSSLQVIERRVNFFGVSEPSVQSAVSNNQYRIIVELPGLSNVEEAVTLIGQTAKLEFREFTDVAAATGGAFVIPTLGNTTSVGLTGRDLKRSSLVFSPQTGEPQVGIEFSQEGANKFSEITARLIDKNLAIFLDEFPITWPKVNQQITDGNAVITGSFDRDTAKTLALQLNAGALPVPVKVVEKRTVGAGLGQESIAASILAGLIGLIVVAIFMIAKYGWLGVIADFGLIMYGLISFAILRGVPITLTLPGIAGFILSIGMAVDSNILIFERYREELRRGKPWAIAMEQAFGKAWDSIRDANFTTILTALILYNPGNWNIFPNSGLVRGFAATLLIGVLVSLFTGIVVTRTYIRVLYHGKNRVAN